MITISHNSFIGELLRSSAGLTGILIIGYLISITIIGYINIPVDSYLQWNNPDYWINYPKDAAPIWTNLGFGPKSFEHQIISDDHAIIKTGKIQGIDTI